MQEINWTPVIPGREAKYVDHLGRVRCYIHRTESAPKGEEHMNWHFLLFGVDGKHAGGGHAAHPDDIKIYIRTLMKFDNMVQDG